MAFKMSLGLIFGLVLVAVFILFLLIAFFRIARMREAKERARNARELPEQEAHRIINSLQGDWEISNNASGEVDRQRITVDGRDAVNKFQEPDVSIFRLHLDPKKLPDGTLILDTTGWKALVFTPEKGYLETQSDEGIKWDWKRVERQMPPGAWAGQMPRGLPPPSGKKLQDFQVSSSGHPNVVDDLQRLNKLKEQGVLTEEEFSVAKFKILHPEVTDTSRDPSAAPEMPPPYPGDIEACAPLMKQS